MNFFLDVGGSPIDVNGIITQPGSQIRAKSRTLVQGLGFRVFSPAHLETSPGSPKKALQREPSLHWPVWVSMSAWEGMLALKTCRPHRPNLRLIAPSARQPQIYNRGLKMYDILMLDSLHSYSTSNRREELNPKPK